MNGATCFGMKNLLEIIRLWNEKKLTFVALENVLAAVIADTRIRWNCRAAAWTLQTLGHACYGLVKVFVFEHQVGGCNRQRQFNLDLLREKIKVDD